MGIRSFCPEERAMSEAYKFLRNESGATAIEYALIAGSISIVILVAAQGIGTDLVSIFTKVGNGFQ
jgi:pilus assembly protein Flp/PilA